jgi:type I restriction enzyme S subunit
MSFPRYPAYKDSGVEWLGEVPEHWPTRRLGYYFAERREKVSDKDFAPLSVTRDGIVPQLETAAKTDDGDNRKRVCIGDFVINSRSDRKGSSGLSSHAGSVSLISTVLSPREDVHGLFVHHLLRSAPFQDEFYRFGKGIVADLWSTNYSAMSGITLAMPSPEEQLGIASFLDRETAKIDALITEQQRLIELLQEKRQAVISHAVTKGLNPDVPMKDSGVEWLGEVPEHWLIKPIKYLGSKASGGTPAKDNLAYWQDGDVPWASSKDLKTDQIDDTQDHLTQLAISEGAAQLQPVDSVFICVRGMILAHTFPVTEPLREMAINQDLKCLVPTKEISSGYLALCLRGLSAEILRRVDEAAHGTKVLRIPDFDGVLLPVPPQEEQTQILSAIAHSLDNLDSLISQASRSMGLLSERRSALISAAVTGQIDVRGLTPVPSAA